jgi:MarR family transcriptional regulator, negative regulator of the multidrug operon emrRAB
MLCLGILGSHSDMTESYSRSANLLGALALAVSDRIREATEREAGGLARSEPAALVSLAHYSGQPVGALGQTLGLTHSGAVRLSDRLEAAGLVRRTRAGPGRTLALHLTEAGQLAAAQVLLRRQAAVEQLVQQLGPGEAVALERLAGLLLAALTTDQASARRLCRLCDEPLCVRDAGCPVDHVAG